MIPKIINEGSEDEQELEEEEQEQEELWDKENYAEDEKEDHFTSQLYQVMY